MTATLKAGLVSTLVTEFLLETLCQNIHAFLVHLGKSLESVTSGIIHRCSVSDKRMTCCAVAGLESERISFRQTICGGIKVQWMERPGFVQIDERIIPR
jgi:hypothetical protein